MPPSSHHPHDKLFRTVLADKEEAEGLLKAYLPETISQQLEWPTLTLVETSFVDEALQDSESDVLYQIQHRTTRAPVLLYFLFEHQSVADKWMRLRLYQYKGRIWAESFKWQSEQEWLAPILSLVFYQGQAAWGHSVEFADLLPEFARQWPTTPQFSHGLIDQSGIHPSEVKGNLKAQIMQLLMLAAYHEPIRETLQLAAKLLASLPTTGGVNYIYLFVHYIVATQEREVVEEFVEAVQQQQIGDKIVMTLAEEWFQEGEAKGKIEGKIESQVATIEKLLQMKMDWTFIKQVTEIDQQGYGELKRQLAQLREHNGSVSRQPASN